MGLINNLTFDNRTPLSKKELSGLIELESRTYIEMGLFNTGSIFVFRCPMCGNIEANDQRLEPACTGKGARNDHPMEPMEFIGVKPKESTAFIRRGI